MTYPQVGTTSANPGQSDPTSYPAAFVFLGNGIGFSNAQPAFGNPGGGLGPDNRFEAYVGDGWKLKKKFTLTYGVHYVRDTGRVDSNLGPDPTFNLWQPGLGNQVRTPNMNFAPQVGFAWDTSGSGKTVIRAGIGLRLVGASDLLILFAPDRIPDCLTDEFDSFSLRGRRHFVQCPIGLVVELYQDRRHIYG